jgi:hypothetical protein
VAADERSDGVVALSRWRAVLARSRNPRKRVDALLAEPNAAAIVPRIPVEDFYYLVRGIGLDDATELVRLASPEQVQGCLDLDLWRRDRLATPRVLAWLDALAELSPSALARVVRALDAELVALVVGREARVFDRSVGEAPDDESPFVVYRTPDAAFVVQFRTTTATAARTIERFIARLYDADPELRERSCSTPSGGRSRSSRRTPSAGAPRGSRTWASRATTTRSASTRASIRRRSPRCP